MRIRSVGVSTVILVAASVTGCNSKNIKPNSHESSKIDHDNYSYPTPSENAAEVIIEEVAISHQSAKTKSQKERATGQLNQSPRSRSNQSNGSFDSGGKHSEREFQKDSDNDKEHPAATDSFSRTTNNIGTTNIEQQQEFTRRGRLSGSQSTNYSYDPTTSSENVGPIMNVGKQLTVQTKGKNSDQSSDFHKENQVKSSQTKDGSTRKIETMPTESQKDYSTTEAESSSWHSRNDEHLENGNGRAFEPPSNSQDIRDDDIVARQLQEAASSEQNSELRRKLWKEYEKYKSGL
ncbi:MAG: hypothetical protein VX986_02725 [Pseudomonadota bacterium]|nr:hypothetical protein [Pseudomonadota bacterium]